MNNNLKRIPRMFLEDEGIRLSWIIAGEEGAVEFHTELKPDVGLLPEYAGVERHSHNGDGQPSYRHCDVLNGPCWHDGSSALKDDGLDYLKGCSWESLWQWLEGLYNEWFATGGRE